MISPHFAKMEEKYPGVKLVKVDVEEQEVGLSSTWLREAMC
jgi:hypothetical protein